MAYNTPLPNPIPRTIAHVDPHTFQHLRHLEQRLLADPVSTTLEAYMSEVKRLLNRALSRHHAQSYDGWSARGRFRHTVRITAVNHELAALVDDVRQHLRGTALLRRFDHIRGLLVDVMA